MDQLASIGVEFDPGALRRILLETERYYSQHPSAAEIPTKEAPPAKDKKSPRPIAKLKGKFPDGLKEQATKVMPASYYKWAADPILKGNHPVRPWGTGAILRAHSPVYTLAGSIVRSPGMYHKLNSLNGKELPEYLEDTCESIHPSVRIRLAVGGLGYDDKKQWDASALTDSGWKLKKAVDGKWLWEYEGKENLPKKILPESEMGHYEERMLELAGGSPNILDFVNNMTLGDLENAGSRKASRIKKANVSEDIDAAAI